MKRYKLFLIFGVLFPTCFTTVAESVSYDRVLRVHDRKIIQFSQMIKEIKKKPIVLLGENHDNMRHHEAELDIIKSLNESRLPLAIGLEMFRSNGQNSLDLWTSGKLTLEKFLPFYYDNWHAPWPWYRDIFLYAKENRIPMIGLNVPTEITEKVARQGFSSLGSEELKQLPPEISCDVDATYMDFISRAHGARAKKDDASFRHFCEAQMLWDKSMAWHLLEFVKKNPGKTVIVLAGVAHSWKRGIALQLRRQSAIDYRVILPEIPGRVGIIDVTSDDADYILLD
ncbi:MAG TPA: hypothetical protein DCP92_16135 [Nitrospiraceae bacterium]|jgi:uncharacterized iron-regulated protein|nr:hypothetical protein [Nitrospiraceae bacterium]